MKVSKLAYVGANATDLAGWRRFASHVAGLELGNDGTDRNLYLRADERHHRLAIHAGADDDVAYVGWNVADHDALDSIVRAVERRGVRVELGTRGELADRRVLALAWFRCPYTGVRMELVIDDETSDAGFDGPHHLSGFVMGELGMGHLGLYTAEVQAAADFYVRTLGFGISDWGVTPEGAHHAAFLHCNARHHSLALVNAPKPPRKLQYVFLETRSLDDIGITYDRCLERNLHATSVRLRANDRSISFYFRNPSRWFLEYGWQLRVVDPANFTTGHYVLKPEVAGDAVLGVR